MTSIIKVNNLQNQCGANTINKCGTAITVGASGDTVTLAAGASQSGFGQTYSAVSWDTTPKTGLFTAVSGVGYFCNTTSAPFTVTLPAGTAGDIVAFADYAATWQTYNVTVTPNGTDKIGSLNTSAVLSTEGQSVTFVYVDATQGWINTMDSTSNVRGNPPFVVATGGTITTVCTDYKVHTFTGPGTFTVTNAGTPAGSDTVDYMVVAGGAAGACMSLCGSTVGGGGGAGGYRFSASTYTSPPTASPLAGSALPVSATAYSIVVGAGSGNARPPVNGSNSSFSTIASAGGGNAGGASGGPRAGGSGGGGKASASCGQPGGVGNTPPTSPAQGTGGGSGVAPTKGGGGGGALVDGGGGTSKGGNGIDLNITGSPVTKGGGGGGANGTNPVGGDGGGGTGSPNATSSGTAGTINTGGGGGGSGHSGGNGGSGGSGIVIIRYKFQ